MVYAMIGEILYPTWCEDFAGPTTALGFSFGNLKVVRLQPLTELLMNLFLASFLLSSLETVGGSGGFHEAYTWKSAVPWIDFVFLIDFLAEKHLWSSCNLQHPKIRAQLYPN